MFSLIFFEREGERGNERKRVRERSIGCLPYMPLPWIEPRTWVCALTENGTHDPLVHGTMLQPSHTSQGSALFS